VLTNRRFAIAAIGACIVLAGAYYAYGLRSTDTTPGSRHGSAGAASPVSAASVPSEKDGAASSSALPAAARSPESKRAEKSASSTQAASSPATAPQTRADPKPQRLDVERQFVNVSPDGARQRFNGETAHASLVENFKNTVQALQDQAFNDATVSELSNSYRSAIVEQLSQIDPNARLSDFACGIQMCLGQIDMAGDVAAWQEWHKKFYADGRTQSYVFMEYDVPMPGGSMQRRFAITIDPKLNAIDVGPPS